MEGGGRKGCGRAREGCGRVRERGEGRMLEEGGTWEEEGRGERIPIPFFHPLLSPNGLLIRPFAEIVKKTPELLKKKIIKL
jgi:hypothetical protein